MLQKPFTGAGTLLYVSNVVLIFFNQFLLLKAELFSLFFF